MLIISSICSLIGDPNIASISQYTQLCRVCRQNRKVKHIFFVAETKGTMESLNLRPIEQAKISCAKKLFNEISTSSVKYHDVDSYQSLLTIMNKM